mgnify:CR=1 FL=1
MIIFGYVKKYLKKYFLYGIIFSGLNKNSHKRLEKFQDLVYSNKKHIEEVPMTDIITTTKNKKFKLIKSLKQKKARVNEGLFVVEGIKSVCDAVASDFQVKYIVMSESFYKDEIPSVNGDIEMLWVKDELFKTLCDTTTPQGIMAVLKIKEPSCVYLDKSDLYIYCDNIQDPGNLGTIIRTADAAGIGGVLLSDGCADLYSPKTVRSSMGSFFNIDIIPGFSYEALFDLKSKGFSLVCGALKDDSKEYTDTDFAKPTVIIVGNEANGVNDDILRECEHIIIPIYGKAESLNAGVAASIMMYEAKRQRKEQNYGR